MSKMIIIFHISKLFLKNHLKVKNYFEENLRLKKKIVNKNFHESYLKEIDFFHLELLKILNNLTLSDNEIHSRNELKILKEFSDKQPFKIVELEKTVGSALIANELFNILVENLFNDDEVYLRINNYPLDDCKVEIYNKLNENF